MDKDHIQDLATATLDGSMPFPEIVSKLMANDVESYLVDYATSLFTFYDANGASVNASLRFERALPPIAIDFDRAALQAAISDSQQHGQKFSTFCHRATLAGVQAYFVFLRGQRVAYFGRQGDQHTEWFPGAKPE